MKKKSSLNFSDSIFYRNITLYQIEYIRPAKIGANDPKAGPASSDTLPVWAVFQYGKSDSDDYF